MGLRGPKPLPNADRLAPHADRQLDTVAADAPRIDPPPEDPSWYPTARVWFASLADTPQAAEYTRAEWGYAYTSAALISASFYSGDYPTALATLDAAARQLMMTRPARLAARLEVETADEPGEVLDLPTNEQLRARVFGATAG